MTKVIEDRINLILEEFGVKEEDLMAIFQKIKFLEIKKGDFFCEIGKVCDKLGILIDGLLLAKFETDKGDTNVSRFFFSPKNLLVTSFDSFKNKKLANESIIAIENSTLIYLTNKDLEELYVIAPSINKIARHFAEESYIMALERIHDLQLLNNRQRIEKFFISQQNLFNRIQRNHIASYLRVNRNDLTKEIKNINKSMK